MEKVLIFNSDKCTGCRVCELVCSIANQGEFCPSKSYIKVIKNKEMDFNTAALGVECNFCGECVEWCVPGAIEFIDLKEAAIKWKGIKVGSLPAPLIGGL